MNRRYSSLEMHRLERAAKNPPTEQRKTICFLTLETASLAGSIVFSNGHALSHCL